MVSLGLRTRCPSAHWMACLTSYWSVYPSACIASMLFGFNEYELRGESNWGACRTPKSRKKNTAPNAQHKKGIFFLFIFPRPSFTGRANQPFTIPLFYPFHLLRNAKRRSKEFLLQFPFGMDAPSTKQKLGENKEHGPDTDKQMNIYAILLFWGRLLAYFRVCVSYRVHHFWMCTL